jgi:hypothetical protein
VAKKKAKARVVKASKSIVARRASAVGPHTEKSVANGVMRFSYKKVRFFIHPLVSSVWCDHMDKHGKPPTDEQTDQEATALLHLSVELPEKLGKGVCIQKIEKFLSSTSIHLCMSLGEAFSNIAMKVRYDDSHTRRLRVYISGPITKGNREDNYDQADEMNRQLIEAGFAPLNPMFSMFSRYAFEIKHSDWMEVDLAWIECADAVIRLPGESVGADMETSHAEKLGIPVFKSVEELKASMGSAALEAKASK